MKRDELFSLKPGKPDAEIKRASKDKWDKIAKPIDGLGELEEMISRIASIQGRVVPEISKKALIIMCADNGVVKEGVSQTGSEVTLNVATLMGKRKSSVGIMTDTGITDIFVYDTGIDSEVTPAGVIDRKIRRGTGDFLKEPAMEESECLKAIETGMAAVKECKEKGYGIIATGEMGIGNTTTAAAVLCGIEGLDPAEYTGRGSGLTDSGYSRKIQVIDEGLRLHRKEGYKKPATSKEEITGIMSSLGGLDIAGLCGVFIGGALCGIPVVIDGFISATAALAAAKLMPDCREYMLASHLGREKGMSFILKELELKPVIHADLALGEGSGAVMLFPLLDMAMSLYTGGTVFEETDIEQYERYDK